MKEHFLRQLDDIEKRNAAIRGEEERAARHRSAYARETVEQLGSQLAAVTHPAFEGFAQALDERGIRVVLRFEAGVPDRAVELPPLAEVVIERGDKDRRYALSYLADGATFVMRLVLGTSERRAILPPARLTESRVRGDLESLLHAALALPDPKKAAQIAKAVKAAKRT